MDQLRARSVSFVLGSPLVAPPASPGPVSVSTMDGRTLEADLWFQCYGLSPATSSLSPSFPLTAGGYLRVTPSMNVAGYTTVYAVGDITAVDVNKVSVARAQAEVAAANIAAQIAGTPPSATYTPLPAAIVLPLGPDAGAGQRGDTGELLTAELVSKLKGADLFMDRYRELFNLA
jgi:NADH dehydrogenase FAD-containing subunit